MFNVNIDNNNILIDNELDTYLNNLKVDYNQFYRGIVIENVDPDRLGRIKVRIPQLYGSDPSSSNYIDNNSIPWANCAIYNAGNDSGSFLPPNIGDLVFVTFEFGKAESPIYFGGIFRKSEGDTKITDGTDVPTEVLTGAERIIYKSSKGATIYIDDTGGAESIKIIDQSGQSIIMENTNDLSLKRRANGIGINPNSRIIITNNRGDSISLTSGQIHLKSKNIILETDNLTNIGLSDYGNEITMANTILG